MHAGWQKKLRRLFSLQFINPGTISMRKGHPVWSMAGYSSHDSGQFAFWLMSCRRPNLLFCEKSTCICGVPTEDRLQQLLDRSLYNNIRNFSIYRVVILIKTNYSTTISEDMILKNKTLLKLILDPSCYPLELCSSKWLYSYQDDFFLCLRVYS